MSLSSLVIPTSVSRMYVNNITNMVADTNGNIIAFNNADTEPKLYFSPLFEESPIGDMNPIDNQLIVDDGNGVFNDPYYVTVHPTMISASTELTTGIIATYGLGGPTGSECLYPFLYRFTGAVPSYSYTQMPFYDWDGRVMVGSGNGVGGKLSLIHSMTVSPDGSNMYISYTERTYLGSPQGMLLKYKSNGSYVNSGPSAQEGGGQGEGFFQILPDLLNISTMVCANGDILYCYYTTTDTSEPRIVKIVSGANPIQIAENLFTPNTGLSANPIIGFACSSDGSILYATDSSSLYKYNPIATAGTRWSVIPMIFNPSVGNLSEIKCDPTGTYIMLSDTTNRSVYFSDDAGITWQTDYPPTLPLPPFFSPVSIACPSEYRQYISYSNGNLPVGMGIYERMSTTVNSQSATFLLTQTSPSQMLTNTDGSKIIMINTTIDNIILYSTDFGNSFSQIGTMTNTKFSKMAASKDFSKILVQMADNTLSILTIGFSDYTLTPLTYNDTTYIPSTDVSSLISVSADGRNMAIVQETRDDTDPNSIIYQYNLWYSIQGLLNGNFVYLGPVVIDDIHVSTISISTGTQPYININTDGGNVYQYRYTGTPLANYTLSQGTAGGISNSIALDTTGQYIYLNVTTASFGPAGVFLSKDYGVNYALIVPTSILPFNDNVFDIACNSTATALMIRTNNGVYFVENINPANGFIGAMRFMSAPSASLKFTRGPITSITSNSNGGRQYFFNSTSGLTSRNSTGSATPCFLEGTKILCLLGDEETYLSVQNLKQGTLVKTLSGFKKVDKIGSSSIQNPGHSGRIMDRLYVCRKENFPELTEDLFITGYHSILVDKLTEDQEKKTLEINGQVIEADGKKCLMAGVSEKAEPWAQEGTFTIWHLSLEDEGQETKFGVYSNGLLTETCSMDYMPASILAQKLDSESEVSKHFFNKSLVCKKSG